MSNPWKTWDDVFDHFRARGCDHSDAAHGADEWQSHQGKVLGAVRDEWDWRIPETVDDVVKLLRRRIEVHMHWRDRLRDNPVLEYAAGTVQSNQRYINQYEAAIRVIESSWP